MRKIWATLLLCDLKQKEIAETPDFTPLSTESVFETIQNKQCVDIHDRVTPLDFWVCILAFTFDLNFNVTYKIVKDNNYMQIQGGVEALEQFVSNQIVDKKYINKVAAILLLPSENEWFLVIK